MSLESKNKISWRPSATFETLRARSEILRTIREFFYARGVMEVDTPLLCQAIGTDPYLNFFQSELQLPSHATPLFLQTSPEFAMKRLLCAGSGSIFQICKAFRNGEQGRLHNPEFTMLEWYRTGFRVSQLMDEMDDLLQLILKCKPAQRSSYKNLFLQFLATDPHTASRDDLLTIAKNKKIAAPVDELDKSGLLQILMTECVEPFIGTNQPVFIFDFPIEQAMLAQIRHDATPVAERFEVYFQGLELANGFQELADADEQRQRFQNDLAKRQQLQYTQPPIDERFLAALTHGLPECSGVALGIDRIMLIALQQNAVADVISFDISRA